MLKSIYCTTLELNLHNITETLPMKAVDYAVNDIWAPIMECIWHEIRSQQWESIKMSVMC